MRYADSAKRATPAPSPGAVKLPPGYHRTPDWSTPKPRDRVIIRSSGDGTVSGQVDALTPDGNLMWVLPDGGQLRKMYYRSDDQDVWSLNRRGS